MKTEQWETVIETLRTQCRISESAGSVAGAAINWQRLLEKENYEYADVMAAVDIYAERGNGRFPGPRIFQPYIVIARKERRARQRPSGGAVTNYQQAVREGRVTTLGKYYAEKIMPGLCRSIGKTDRTEYEKHRQQSMIIEYAILHREKKQRITKHWSGIHHAIFDELENLLTTEQKEKAMTLSEKATVLET